MKKLILLLDGTWNDADFGGTDTNIVRLRDRIASDLEASDGELAASDVDVDTTGERLLARSYRARNRDPVYVFYERGVGTGAIDRIRGGAFGFGLTKQIRAAYRFLSFFYEPGDQVFIFGFSRGAYTARSLVGFVAAAGLLRPQHCTPDLEERAWAFYRTAPRYRLPGVWHELQHVTRAHADVRFACLGVFDTVGALGIPLHQAWRANRALYEFHDVELSSIVALNLHAVAIDEHRLPFQATLWQKPKFKKMKGEVEQVWFSGAHADIGGSYVPENLRYSRYQAAPDEVSLDWMMKRVKKSHRDFPYRSDPFTVKGAAWSWGGIHEARRSIYRFWPKAYRAIANIAAPQLGYRETAVGFDRHASVFNEKVHISALEKLGETISIDGRKCVYRPKNLCAALDRIMHSYDAPGPGALDLPVVDWTGETIVADAAGCARVKDLVLDARRRLPGSP